MEEWHAYSHAFLLGRKKDFSWKHPATITLTPFLISLVRIGSHDCSNKSLASGMEVAMINLDQW